MALPRARGLARRHDGLDREACAKTHDCRVFCAYLWPTDVCLTCVWSEHHAAFLRISYCYGLMKSRCCGCPPPPTRAPLPACCLPACLPRTSTYMYTNQLLTLQLAGCGPPIGRPPAQPFITIQVIGTHSGWRRPSSPPLIVLCHQCPPVPPHSPRTDHALHLERLIPAPAIPPSTFNTPIRCKPTVPTVLLDSKDLSLSIIARIIP